MQVCNISFQIEPQAETLWLGWMQQDFIPSIMATACFVDYKFYQLEVEATQAPTYTLQVFTNDPQMMELYRSKHAASLMYSLHHTWGEQCFHFSSYMKIVN